MATKPIEPIRALTAVRGIAAWWVVVYHFREALPASTPELFFHIMSYGYLAVDLFFILSGFVIALNYAKWFENKNAGIGGYKKFLQLRLSRIYPLHFFMLLMFLSNPIAVIVFSNLHRIGDLHINYYLLSFFLMQGWGISRGTAWNVPAWSISVEWLAYLLFPVLAKIIFRLTRKITHTLSFLFLLLFFLGAATYLISPGGLGYDIQTFGIMRCLIEFSVGIGVYRLGYGRLRTRAESNAAIFISIFCFSAYAFVPLQDYIFMPLGFAAIVHGLSDERGKLAALLRIPPLQWLGLVSYSTYLSHYFIKIWVKFIFVRPSIPVNAPFWIYASIILICSALLHSLVERPGQQWLRVFLASTSKQKIKSA